MNIIPEHTELTSRLDKVGLTAGAQVDFGAGSVAETWTSDYAELYLVDAAAVTIGGISELLSRLDRIVATRLRQQRDAGRFLDAHVCILVSKEMLRDDQLKRESDASRYVSRKYWIDRSAPVEEILRRLTLTWVEVDAAAPGSDSQHLQEFSDLRKRIAARMGSGAASEFLEVLRK